ILAATVKTRQKLMQAYWFQPEHEEGGYYTADGTSLRKTFLLTPIEFRASVRAFPMPAFTRYCRPCAPTRVRTTRHRSAGTYWPWLMA
ncbi:MAG TPA: hypothetical protein PKD33_17790, partial [Rhodocyclaceae bacterium]|nr:hypothetical protein [Rhodocyclaceae bacterium]